MPETAKTIVLATRNKGKIAELSEMLAGFGLTVLGLSAFPEIGEIEETGATFAENARIKAQAVCAATGLVAVADDSGLCVDALSGAPGVYSARYAGEKATDADNNAKLLAALADVPEEERAARFVCAICAAAPDGRLLEASGAWEGRIAFELSGENGFGYDPLFYDEMAGTTSANLTSAQKNARSHRGKALAALKSAWGEFA
jgi:XTP/dITP diphosphohydrolase